MDRLRDQLVGWAVTAALAAAVLAGAAAALVALVLAVVAMPLTTVAVVLLVGWGTWEARRRRRGT